MKEVSKTNLLIYLSVKKAKHWSKYATVSAGLDHVSSIYLVTAKLRTPDPPNILYTILLPNLR